MIREFGHMYDQDPKVTMQWALLNLERALQNLNDGCAERRVRRQFHQLLLAVERDVQYIKPVEHIQTDWRLADRVSLRPQ